MMRKESDDSSAKIKETNWQKVMDPDLEISNNPKA
jgi:hypothetical protein